MLHPNWRIRRNTTHAELLQNFNRPGKEYLPYAYWFWIDENPDPAVYRREAAELTAGGYAILPQDRGFHADKETWFACFDAAMEEAKKADACLEYSEKAGCQRGLHIGEPSLLAVSLACDPADLQPGETVSIKDNFFTVIARRTESGSIDSDTLQLVTGESYAAGEDGIRVYGFTVYNDATMEGGRGNFLCHGMTEKILESIHSEVLSRYADELGKTIAGHFFDLEGDYGYKLCWSAELEEEYQKRTGRDFRLFCPLLLEEDEQGKWMRARYDFLDAVSEVYTRVTFGDISDALEEKGLYMGGHIWEERLLGQVLLSGDPMRIYRSMSMPSIDHLDISAKNVRTYKELQSVCELEGKRSGCEILSISGWETNSADLREAVNNAVTHGISHLIMHGIYSNREEIDKATYGQDFFDWAPMWEWNRYFTDYMHRASWMISQGRMKTDVMLYNPIESVWALLGDNAYNTKIDYSMKWTYDKPCLANDFAQGAEIQRIDDEFVRTLYELTAARVQFLIGDRHYVRTAEIRNSRLYIGEHSFMTIVFPSVRILSLSVVRKVWELLEDGGYAIFLGTLPTASAENGMNDPLMKEWIDKIRKHPHCTVSCHIVPAGVGISAYMGSEMLPAACTFTKGEFFLHVQHRIIDGRSFYWLANNNRKVQDCALYFPGQHGRVFCWDAQSGERHPLASVDTADGSTVPLVFEESDGFFLEFDPTLPVYADPESTCTHVFPIEGDWKIRIDKNRQPRPTGYNAGVPDALYSGIVSPLADWQDLGMPQFSGCVEYEKTFTLPTDAEVLEIDLGKVNYMAMVSLDNGEEIGRLWGPYRFRFTNIPAGEHTIHIHAGNLMNNILAPHQFENGKRHWHLWDPKPETFRSGIFGPVVCRYR